LTNESIFDAPALTRKCGRPQKYSNGLTELGLMVKSIYRLPYRGLEGFLCGLFNYSAQNKPIPDYSTFCVRAADLDVEVKTSLKSGNPLHVLVDSTGLKIYEEGEWKVRTHGASKRRTYLPKIWRKLHLVMDAKTQQIIGMSLTKNDVGD
jgi:Transposase DDE domain